MHQDHLSRFFFLFVSFLCSLFIFVIWILIVNYRVYDNFVVLIQPCLLIMYRGMSNLQFNHLYSYIKVCLIQHKWLYITTHVLPWCKLCMYIVLPVGPKELGNVLVLGTTALSQMLPHWVYCHIWIGELCNF